MTIKGKTTKLQIYKSLKKPPLMVAFKLGGGGIRTHGTLARSTVFKTAPINRSGTPPNDYSDCIFIVAIKF